MKVGFVGAVIAALAASDAMGDSILCPAKEYAQYKDAVAWYGFATEYCSLSSAYELARKQHDLREMEQCERERRKAADALSTARKPLPDCVALDPKRAEAATCRPHTKVEYNAMAKTEAGRTQLKQEFCAAAGFMTMRPGMTAPTADDMVRCINASSAMEGAARAAKITKADCQN